MRWRSGRRSTNIEDRRGRGLRPAAGAGLGGGAILLIAVVYLLMGEDPTAVVEVLQQAQPPSASLPGGPVVQSGADDELADFVSVVLADTEDTWTQLFDQMGGRYQPPVLVLFSDAVQSACGFASAAAGPFYCPGDRQVYIDLGFYRELRQQFGAPGDFAQAYVIAHEVGHHVQNLMGISEEVQRLRARLSQQQANTLSVRQELQADCLAGVWGYHADRQRALLEQGDVEEGLNAAAAIGDDRIQRHTAGQINPESWTHGSSEQRARWFRRGLEQGRVDLCDTFGADRL